MPTFRVLVLSEPVEGKRKEFNDWYENTHLDEVIATTGWKSARRYQLASESGTSCPLPYLAEYLAEAEDADAVLNTLNETRAQRRQSDSINRRTAGVWIFQELGPEHTA